MRSNPEYRDTVLAIEARKRMVVNIAGYARFRGLMVTDDQVSRHLKWFKLWYHGTITTGQLIGRTGLKLRQVNK